VCRGKKPTKKYFSIIGSAHSFGCYVEKPFGELIAEKYKLECLNLGFAGVGPAYHLRMPYWDLINKGKFCIIQIMSARSERNNKFDNYGENIGIYEGVNMTPLEFWTKQVLKLNKESLMFLINETRNNYINNMISVLKRINVPKILFYFSDRELEYKTDLNSLFGIWNRFPHFVNREIVNKIKPYSDCYVHCVTSRGMPQKLDVFIKDNFLSKYYISHPNVDQVKNYNNYYPSPEMHFDASKKLEAICEFILRRHI
jgi:hypothetical protein